MKIHGQLRKMATEMGNPVRYFLNISCQLIDINALIGKEMTISHTGYECINCGSEEKIFRMGFCKKCFFESPYASETIIRPELSMAHLGVEERNIEVEREIQLQPHIVYLTYTGDVKVGVTRASQIPTRWIDQGATFAIPIARTENRYEAGMIEVELKKHLPDKTNWRKMLQDERESSVDLENFKQQILQYIPSEYHRFYLEKNMITTIDYPYEAPSKLISLSLEKYPEISGILRGIKGQYLCFEGGGVINIRNHEGFVVDWNIEK